MKRLVFLALTANILLLPALCIASEKGQPAETAAPQAEAAPRKKTFIIHLTNGGSITTDNYTMEKDTIRVMLVTGAIYLEKGMVKDIEEVQGIEQETVETITVEPKPEAKPAERPAQPETQAPPGAEGPYVQKDDQGHTEAWWKKRVDEWKKKKADAQARYERAKDDWNKYDGILQGLAVQVPLPQTEEQIKNKVVPVGPVGSQYDIVRNQDLRGAARAEMDSAQADMEEADRMLKDVLPEQARKAGAPPGWVR